MRFDLDHVGCRACSELPLESHEKLHLQFSGDGSDGAMLDLYNLRNICYLPNCLQPGQSLCITSCGYVPLESVSDSFSVQFFLDQRKAGKASERYDNDFDCIPYAGQVCVLGNLFSRNFGHWTEELLKVVILEQANYAGVYMMSRLPHFALDFLDILGISRERVVIVDHPVLIESAVFTTAINHENIWQYKDVIFCLRAMTEKYLDPSTDPISCDTQSRLWLDRSVGVHNGGVVINAGEVERILKKHDIHSVDMGSLSVKDQLRLIRTSRLIVGAHGSQFVHAQFMDAGSTVIECFSPMYVNPSVLGICKALDHAYYQVVSRCNSVSPYLHGRDCVVDVQLLDMILSRI